MKRISTVVAGACTIALALGAAPAYAQYANEFSIAKVVKQGTTSQSIAGSGTVTVQVQVNADGSHKVIKVIRSTNAGDNAAALEIAQNSTYRPARKGKKPITTFYDFVLKFNGKAVAPAAGVAGEIDALIRGKQYASAIDKANAALANSPNDPQVLQLLGIAQYYNGDIDASAAAFARVDSVNKDFRALAAQALASAAVRAAAKDPAQSLAFAQKSLSLSNDANSTFALGVAQIANKQYADAIATLKPAREKATSTKAKLALDRELLQAYLGSGDTASSSATAADIKALDPSSTDAQLAFANHYLTLGNQAMAAKNFTEALKDFEAADAQAGSLVAVTANTGAAFAELSMEKPDYAKARDYAMKAVAAGPNDATANFAAGISWTGVYSTSHKSSDKQQAVTFLNKADQLAKAAGNTQLSAQIENQLKNIPQ
ncbi:MAG: energy transducer TonB [bacterium]|nr:energy transducer TonB [bacterium]